jgi:hypothetical protein
MPLHIPGGHAVCPTCKRKLFSGDRAQWDHIYNWKLFGPTHPLLLALTEYTLLSAPLSHFLLHAYITWSFCSSQQSLVWFSEFHPCPFLACDSHSPLSSPLLPACPREVGLISPPLTPGWGPVYSDQQNGVKGCSGALSPKLPGSSHFLLLKHFQHQARDTTPVEKDRGKKLKWLSPQPLPSFQYPCQPPSPAGDCVPWHPSSRDNYLPMPYGTDNQLHGPSQTTTL